MTRWIRVLLACALVAGARAGNAVELRDRNGAKVPAIVIGFANLPQVSPGNDRVSVLYTKDSHALGAYGFETISAQVRVFTPVIGNPGYTNDQFPSPVSGQPSPVLFVWENSSCSGPPKAGYWTGGLYNNGGNEQTDYPPYAVLPLHPNFAVGELLWPRVLLGTPLGTVASFQLNNQGCDNAFDSSELDNALRLVGWPTHPLGSPQLTEVVSTGISRVLMPLSLIDPTIPEVPPPPVCDATISSTGGIAPDGSPIFCTRIDFTVAPGKTLIPHGIGGVDQIVSLRGVFGDHAAGGAHSIPHVELGPTRTVTVAVEGASLVVSVVDRGGSWSGLLAFVEVEFTLIPES